MTEKGDRWGIKAGGAPGRFPERREVARRKRAASLAPRVPARGKSVAVSLQPRMEKRGESSHHLHRCDGDLIGRNF